jgi:hypothetical protein
VEDAELVRMVCQYSATGKWVEDALAGTNDVTVQHLRQAGGGGRAGKSGVQYKFSSAQLLNPLTLGSPSFFFCDLKKLKYVGGPKFRPKL